MRRFIFSGCLSLISLGVMASDADSENRNSIDGLQENEILIGDMIIRKNDGEGIGTLGVVNQPNRWDRVIHYYVSYEEKRNYIERAVKAWADASMTPEGFPAIKFQEINHPSEAVHYIDFVKNNEGRCFAHVGRVGGRQLVSLDSDCNYGNVLHEVGHTLGFEHEHNHPDRDECMQIYWDNIKESDKVQFEKRGATSGGAYDPLSIMHYPVTAFGGGRKTINIFSRCIPSGYSESQIGLFDWLSDTDRQEVTGLYGNFEYRGYTLISDGISIYSPDFSHTLKYENFGQLVIYNQYGWPLWQTSRINTADSAMLWPDGRIVLKNGSVRVWEGGYQNGRTDGYFYLTNNGVLERYNRDGQFVWSTRENYLTTSELMRHNRTNRKTSPDGKNKLLVQSDGNVVLYNEFGAAIWSTGTGMVGPNAYLRLLSNGDLVLYDESTNKVAWRSNGDRSTTGMAHMLITDRGEVQILDRPGGRLLWSSLH